MTDITIVRRAGTQVPPREICFLEEDNWDDFGYKTLYNARLVDASGKWFELGPVKVMRAGKGSELGRNNGLGIGTTFEGSLPSDYYSLGQDQSYYEAARSLGVQGERVLRSLGDIVLKYESVDSIRDDLTYTTSLTRSVSEDLILKFRQILQGTFERSAFSFSYQYPRFGPVLDFPVRSGSNPPSNVHALIGRNGVGKTSLLSELAKCLASGAQVSPNHLGGGMIIDAIHPMDFSGVIQVSFSAFDSFDLPNEQRKSSRMSRRYIGLRKVATEDDPSTTKSSHDLARDFARSTDSCLSGVRAKLWLNAMSILSTDPIIEGLHLADLANQQRESREAAATALYETASSGHKIVLLAMSQLVDSVSDRCLVLVDEPESHLHPPLLASFIRALSELLAAQNGVAILATHSPVVLQEVPRSCVWILGRNGQVMDAYRPDIQTFAENISLLTSAAFSLEVKASGHFARIAEACTGSTTLDDVILKFNGELGSDGRAIAISILREANRSQ